MHLPQQQIVLKITGKVLFWYLIIALLLFLAQRKLMYFPQTAANLNKVEQVQFQTDVELHGWVLNPGKPQAIIYYGGNAEADGYNHYEFSQLFPDYSVYLINYRGFGNSQGSPSEQTLFSDAEAIYQQLQKKHDSISLIGRSLGSGIAAYVASRHPVTRLALITPYNSIQEIAQQRFKMFPMSILLKDKYESWKYVGDITAETLILVAEFDQVIPLENTNKLIEYFKKKTEVKLVTNADHYSIDMTYLGEFFSHK